MTNRPITFDPRAMQRTTRQTFASIIPTTTSANSLAYQAVTLFAVATIALWCII